MKFQRWGKYVACRPAENSGFSGWWHCHRLQILGTYRESDNERGNPTLIFTSIPPFQMGQQVWVHKISLCGSPKHNNENRVHKTKHHGGITKVIWPSRLISYEPEVIDKIKTLIRLMEHYPSILSETQNNSRLRTIMGFFNGAL